ncbi:hypothetical protein BGZ60DRAFT_415833 [Tricladium varicosporioides]|nr:hypothetical protein BGZ60DRAFT_415833 [Hymenoscyphus varicosporioides]
MSSSQKPSRYSSIPLADSHTHSRSNSDSLDLDLTAEELNDDNDSDATLASTSFLKHTPHHPQKSNTPFIVEEEHVHSFRCNRQPRWQIVLTWIRWSIVVFLQGIILMLLLPRSGILDGGWDIKDTETGGDVNGLYIPTKHKYTLLTPEEEKFVPNMTSDANRMEIRHNWDMLMPLGSGSVEINDYANYPMLGKPIVDDPIRNGSLFEASWTHALHCLYYTVDTYHQLTISNGTKFGFDGERNDYHAAHCFEYLRNQILCMSDMTLEGSESVLDATGMGQAHMCRDRSEAIGWIEERRVDDIQSIVGP